MLSSDSSKYKIHQTDYDQATGLISQVNEDANIHPNELSGDQNGEQSIFASTVESTKANFFLTVTTIIKTVIGSGILAIPFSMSKMGWIFGTLVFLFAGVVTQFGSVLLLKAKNLSHHSNYATIFFTIWQNKAAKGLGSLLIFLNNIGICIAELIIFKTTIHKIIREIIENSDVDQTIIDQFYVSQILIVIVMALLESPLTFISKMEKLRFMSMMGVIGIVVFMVSFVAFYITTIGGQNPPVGDMRTTPDNWFKAAAAVPNILLALSYQMNFFPVFKGMKNVTDSRMSRAVICGVLFCTASYLLVGILGYDYVGPDVKANFLESLSYDKIPKAFFFIINFGFLISIFFAFPIMFFGCRNNFIALIKLALLTREQYKQKQWRADADQEEQISSYIRNLQTTQRRKKAKLHFVLYTLAIYLIIVGVALSVQDIQVVFNIVGAICSSSIGVLLPCLFYFMLIKQKNIKKGWKYYVAIVLLAVMTPYSIFSIVALYVEV